MTYPSVTSRSFLFVSALCFALSLGLTFFSGPARAAETCSPPPECTATQKLNFKSGKFVCEEMTAAQIKAPSQQCSATQKLNFNSSQGIFFCEEMSSTTVPPTQDACVGKPDGYTIRTSECIESRLEHRSGTTCWGTEVFKCYNNVTTQTKSCICDTPGK